MGNRADGHHARWACIEAGSSSAAVQNRRHGLQKNEGIKGPRVYCTTATRATVGRRPALTELTKIGHLKSQKKEMFAR